MGIPRLLLAQVSLSQLEGYPKEPILDLLEDQTGIIWIATPHHINVFNGTGFQRIDCADQWISANGSSVKMIWESNNGEMIIGMSDKTSILFDPKKRVCRSYKSQNQVPTSQFIEKGNLMDVRGWNWQMIDDHLTVSLNKSESGFRPFIQDLEINGQVQKLPIFVTSENKVVLPYNKNVLALRFAVPAAFAHPSLTYQYSLLGLDTSWINNGDQRLATYANIGSGTYILKIRTKAPGGWVENDHALLVDVITPVWSAWWFHVLVILMVIGTLAVIYKIRINAAIRRALEIEEIRKKEASAFRLMMARDFHDEMGNKLASIIVIASTLEYLIKDKSEEVKKALQKIESASKSLFDGTKSFIWSINPQSDHLREIISYVNHFGNELFEQTPMKFYLAHEVEDAADAFILPVGYSRQIFFVFKEAMTNALIHSQGSKVVFDYTYSVREGEFCLSLWDNGTGLKEDQKISRGLQNMMKRAEKIGCLLSLTSNPEGGLSVTLSGSIKKSEG